MIRLRSLTRVLATLLVVVSCLMPFAARAHADHGHRTVAQGGGAVPCHGVGDATADAAAALDERQRDADGPAGVAQPCGCLGCHLTLIAPDGAPLATVVATRAVRSWPEDAVGTSVRPEALPKPPRTFA